MGAALVASFCLGHLLLRSGKPGDHPLTLMPCGIAAPRVPQRTVFPRSPERSARHLQNESQIWVGVPAIRVYFDRRA